jgi:hypothetical protein
MSQPSLMQCPAQALSWRPAAAAAVARYKMVQNGTLRQQHASAPISSFPSLPSVQGFQQIKVFNRFNIHVCPIDVRDRLPTDQILKALPPTHQMMTFPVFFVPFCSSS